jgi:chromosome segregation ATPase
MQKATEQRRLETAAQMRRFDEEKAELEAALAEAVRLRNEAEHQLGEAQNRNRTEQQQFVQQTANLERLTQEVAHRRTEVEASLQKADEEDRKLLETQQATEQMRLETAAQLRQFEEEKAELQASVETRQAEVARLREMERELTEAENGTRAELRRLDEEKAELEAAVQAQRTGAEELRRESEAQIQRFGQEKVKLEAAIETRQAEVARLCQVERELNEVESGTRAEHEQLLRQTADLERLTEEVAQRRAEVEASLHKANEENGRLLEMQQAAEQSRQEILWLEPEICQRTTIDQSVLELEHLHAEAEEHKEKPIKKRKSVAVSRAS